MYALPRLSPPADYKSIAWPQDSAVDARISDCLDFSNGEEAQRDVPIADALAVTRRAAEVCKRSGDMQASLQLSDWRRQVEDLERDLRHEVRAWAGSQAEDLRWRVLRFERRNDVPWRDLCRAIDRYFDWKSDATRCHADHVNTGDDAHWEAALGVQRLAGEMLEQLYPLLRQVRAQTAPPCGPPSAWEEAAPGASTRSDSPLTPSAPPMSTSWFDEHRIAYPPEVIGGRKTPSPVRTVTRP
ncbi:MAG: hypothetical protein EOP37_16000 [Rubrivivax sp.]|nr:MAG: hypothetical protein EOP37_16000 [Rubrivivax sp.]